MQTREIKYYLGIDWGDKRIGLALGESETKLALPFKTVGSVKEVEKIVSLEKIDGIILGWPKKMSGEAASGKWQNFYNSLKLATKVPIILQDERLTSLAADNLSGNYRQKASRDELSAVLVLQSYFDKYL